MTTANVARPAAKTACVSVFDQPASVRAGVKTLHA